ncbi:MAG: ribonuclease PH [Proteobacteria bacterium]|nr:ribonuclease PH [Pseudomonadota bacterium]
MRSDGRTSDQMRPLRITPDFIKNATGSALIEFGDTRVLCTAMIEDGIPGFLRNSQPAQGWLTAEYSMLPGATLTRSKRERQNVGGRTQEIQRLIGRSIRGVIDLTACPDMTIQLDCDVLQADGGTRTASITGAYVALSLALGKLVRSGKLKRNPLRDGLAAVSIGIRAGQYLVDLNYVEDSSADLDMNVVMTHSGKILEIQGTAEKGAFDKHQVLKILDLAEGALKPVFGLQLQAAEGVVAEG